MLSVRSCRKSLPEAAPRASRMLISFVRPVARARRRLATFAQAISKTNPTAIINTNSGSATRARKGEIPCAPSTNWMR